MKFRQFTHREAAAGHTHFWSYNLMVILTPRPASNNESGYTFACSWITSGHHIHIMCSEGWARKSGSARRISVGAQRSELVEGSINLAFGLVFKIFSSTHQLIRAIDG